MKSVSWSNASILKFGESVLIYCICGEFVVCSRLV